MFFFPKFIAEKSVVTRGRPMKNIAVDVFCAALAEKLLHVESE